MSTISKRGAFHSVAIETRVSGMDDPFGVPKGFSTANNVACVEYILE